MLLIRFFTHRLEQSRSQRILWLLEELKIPYELKIFHRDPKTKFAPPELKEIHALGKSPIISITPAGSTESVTIAESGLIVEYLLEHFGQNSSYLPKRWKDGQEGKIAGETEEWLRYKYYLQYCEGSLTPFLTIRLVVSCKLTSSTFDICDLSSPPITAIEKAPVPFL